MSMRKNILALSLFEAAKILKEQAEGVTAGVPVDDETGEAITLDHILDRFNTIRSGKSFSDPEVYGKLTSLFKGMTSEDKLKLNQQLRNIGAVVQNQTPVDIQQSAEAPAPPTPGAPPTPEASPAAAPPPAAGAPPPAV